MREARIFGPEIAPFGKPTGSSVALSVVLHGAAIAALVLIPSRSTPSREEAVDRSVPSPTEIRIGDRIYFVANLDSADKAAPKPRPAAPKKKVEAAKSSKPSAPAPAPAPRERLVTRAYVPPEIRRDKNATQVLIQPQSPPDLMASGDGAADVSGDDGSDAPSEIPKSFRGSGASESGSARRASAVGTAGTRFSACRPGSCSTRG